MLNVKSTLLLFGYLITGLLGCGGSGADKVAASKSADERVLLKLNLKEGDRRKLVMTTKSTATLTADDKSQTMTSTVGIELDFNIKAVDSKGLHTIEITYDRIWMKARSLNAQDNEIDFDSGDPDSIVDADKMPLAVLVGKTLTATFQPDGSVSDVRGLEELAAAHGQLADSFDEAIKSILAVFSQAPVKVGDKWSHSLARQVGPGLEANADTTYVYVDEATGWAERADYSMKTFQHLGKSEIASETTLEIRAKK